MRTTDEYRRRHQGGIAAPEPLAVDIPGAQRLTGFSRTGVYRELQAGNLKAIKQGTRTLVLVDSIKAYLASLPAAEFRSSKAA